MSPAPFAGSIVLRAKDPRFGLFLGKVRFARPDRLERMLLVAAIVHFLAMLAGAAVRTLGLCRLFRANTVRNKATHSDFTLGLYYLPRLARNRSIALRFPVGSPAGAFWG